MKDIAKKILIAILIPWTAKRMWMGLIGLITINAKFWCAVYYLYSFPNEPLTGYFYKMAMFAMGIDATIVLWFIGLQTIKPQDAVSSLFEKILPH